MHRFSLLIFGLSIIDILALHDIKKDYISVSFLEDSKLNIQQFIPEWAKCKLEWTFIQISLLLKIILSVSGGIFLLKAYKNQ